MNAKHTSVPDFAADISLRLHPTHERLAESARILLKISHTIPQRGELYGLYRDLINELAVLETTINGIRDELLDAASHIDWTDA